MFQGVSSKDEVGANVAVPMLAPILTKAGGPLIKLELNRNQSNTVDTVEFVDEGFAVIPQGGILSFKGRVTADRVLFLSVKVGEGEVIADNVSQCPKTCVIVTPDKGLVDAISSDKCWIDKNGKIYYCDVCNSTKPCVGHDRRSFNVTISGTNQVDPGLDPVPDKEKDKVIDGMVVTEDVIVQEDIGRDLVQESAPPPNEDPPPYHEATATNSFEKNNPDYYKLDFTEVQPSNWQSLVESDFAEKLMKQPTSAIEHHSAEKDSTVPPVSSRDQCPDDLVQGRCATEQDSSISTVLDSSQDSSITTQNQGQAIPDSITNHSFPGPSSEQPIQETSSQQSVVFRGVPENNNEDLWEIIRSTLEEMSLPGMIHSIAVISRIGRENPEKARAIRVLFKKEADAVALLGLSKQPRHRIRRKGVFVCQYYSEVEMKEFYRKQRQKARKEKEREFIPTKIRKEGEFVPAKIRKEGDFVPANIERAKKKDISLTPNPLNSKNNTLEETEMEAVEIVEVEEPVVDGHFKNVVMHRNME
eukprot:sb/3463795/